MEIRSLSLLQRIQLLHLVPAQEQNIFMDVKNQQGTANNKNPINRHRLQIIAKSIPQLKWMITRNLHIKNHLTFKLKRRSSFRMEIPSQIIHQIISALPIIAMFLHSNRKLGNLVLRRKQCNRKMILTPIVNFLIQPQIQIIIPEIPSQQQKNNAATKYFLKMRTNFPINENIRPYQPFLTLSAFVQSGTRKFVVDLFHALKVKYGSNYAYDVWKTFVAQHTWIHIPNSMQCDRSFGRDKVEVYYSSEISHFIEHATIIRKNFTIYDVPLPHMHYRFSDKWFLRFRTKK